MKVIFNGKEVYELQEWQKKVIQNDIPSSIFDNDMTRRCKYWLEAPAEKYAHQHKEKMRQDLMEKGERYIPTNLISLAEKHAIVAPLKKQFRATTRAIPCQVGDQSFEFSEAHQKVLMAMRDEQYKDRSDEEVVQEEDKECCERMAWILKDKFTNCMRRLRAEWTDRLASKGLKEVPADDEVFATLVFSQPDYKNREQRDAEAEL